MLKAAVGVTVSGVDPEHAVVTWMPWPNSTTPPPNEMFAASVLLRKKEDPINRSTKVASA